MFSSPQECCTLLGHLSQRLGQSCCIHTQVLSKVLHATDKTAQLALVGRCLHSLQRLHSLLGVLVACTINCVPQESALGATQNCLGPVHTQVPFRKPLKHVPQPDQQRVEVCGMHYDVIDKGLNTKSLNAIENLSTHKHLEMSGQPMQPERCSDRLEKPMGRYRRHKPRCFRCEFQLVVPRTQVQSTEVLTAR